MANRLVVPTGRIHRLARELQIVADALGGSGTAAARLADAAGHDRLGREIEESARCWQQRRSEVVAEVANLAQACGGIATAFDDVDVHLAQAV